jgi:hypothetical protein
MVSGSCKEIGERARLREGEESERREGGEWGFPLTATFSFS